MVHVSVMPGEVLSLLDPQPGQTFVDCTVGLGGHTRLLAERVGPTGRVIGLDQDPTMLAVAAEQSKGLPIEFVHVNYENLQQALKRLNIERVDGILADLGFCSDQIADAQRGFSFQSDGPLDMRLDPTTGEPASVMLQRLSERDIADIIYRYVEERHSRRVAREIVARRKTDPLETTGQLAELVRRCVPRGKHHSIDPATRTFQALRIAVNDELGALERLLASLPYCLNIGGRAAIISFHSLEDRLVKHAFREKEHWEVLTKKPLVASDEEIERNARSRSAKLRGAKLIRE
ncbi:MAG: 16S rRNA (cytosine(1402)-N(4))-methyltransferase RsmH [Gemmataceae bacterium]